MELWKNLFFIFPKSPYIGQSSLFHFFCQLRTELLVGHNISVQSLYQFQKVKSGMSWFSRLSFKICEPYTIRIFPTVHVTIIEIRIMCIDEAHNLYAIFGKYFLLLWWDETCLCGTAVANRFIVHPLYDTLMNGATVEWYWQGKTKGLTKGLW
jgi:hypothetical protein